MPKSFTDPHSDRIILLADDVTGACSAGAAFLRSGRSARVWFGSSVRFSAPESVQAFSTNSRLLSPHRAAREVSRAAATLGTDSNAFFFKKVDSAARGPFAAEVLAAYRALAFRAVLLAPAFPSAGRVVRDGVLEIQNAVGQSTPIRLADLFPRAVRSCIGAISQPSDLAPAIESGKTILLCDSATQADLFALARAAQPSPGLLYAGSAGLAYALAALTQMDLPVARIPFVSRSLLIVGSRHPAAKLQLDHLASHAVEGVRVLGIRRPFRARARIRAAFRSFAPQALILAGGQTALLALQALEAHSLTLHGELAPGVPWGLVQGGAAHGSVVVTLSDGFGKPTVFNDILTALQGPA